jgi:hypothetical protein
VAVAAVDTEIKDLVEVGQAAREVPGVVVTEMAVLLQPIPEVAVVAVCTGDKHREAVVQTVL